MKRRMICDACPEREKYARAARERDEAAAALKKAETYARRLVQENAHLHYQIEGLMLELEQTADRCRFYEALALSD